VEWREEAILHLCAVSFVARRANALVLGGPPDTAEAGDLAAQDALVGAAFGALGERGDELGSSDGGGSDTLEPMGHLGYSTSNDRFADTIVSQRLCIALDGETLRSVEADERSKEFGDLAWRLAELYAASDEQSNRLSLGGGKRIDEARLLALKERLEAWIHGAAGNPVQQWSELVANETRIVRAPGIQSFEIQTAPGYLAFYVAVVDGPLTTSPVGPEKPNEVALGRVDRCA
jgi:hypothetical protein